MGRRPALELRLFTPGERAYAARLPDPVPRLATRFATKEAVLKALGLGLGAFGFHDVEVVRHGLDAPEVVLHGAAASAARAAGVGRWHLSLTHTDLVALAAVVADGATGPTGDDVQPVLTVAEMQEVDARAAEVTPLDELVARAGTAVARAAVT